MLVVGVAVRLLWVMNVPVVSVAGFLVMLGGAVLSITSRRETGAMTGELDRKRFEAKMERRFRRRFGPE